ncbi:hypothetical protein FHZ96_02260 [Listeria monocytogenes]|uniref:hypothetical protein n=1 Tax=Listeria monocytogenes TaxID=1639 RepID=UPI0010CE5492|nr:hypothetical protein [Listeria monocytogenes]EAD0693789.1 hypothetical protein [Listeria monocytogenes]EAD3875827.1 hypothetical protein [Listeria monocytogenes]EAD4265644.1 hypothetical protein [Listeria monocytogenes]EAD7780855.1 hypothetical protein [Listeria monocytogenes]EAD8958562.1 hypothetical protein [Listeria monocytogenes]
MRQNILTKHYFLILGGLLLIVCLFPYTAKAAENTNLPQSNEIIYDCNKNLSADEVDKRFNDISTKYVENEAFSKEDAEFVVRYSDKEEKEDPAAKPLLKGVNFYKGTSSKSFNKSKTSMGVKVTFSGKINSHLNALNPGDQWYSGKTTAKINSGSSKVKKIKSVVSQNTYGLIGNSGTYVGLVHKSSLSSTTSKKGATTNYLDQKKKYSALLVSYAYTTTYVEVSTTSGTFNLYGI